MQNEGLNNLYRTLEGVVPKNVLTSKNKAKTWKYGYDAKYDIVVISKTGDIGDIIEIQGLRIALPKVPKSVYSRSKKKSTIQKYNKKESRMNYYSRKGL